MMPTTRITAIAVSGLALLGCDPNLSHTDAHQPYGGGNATPLSCLPNLDGVIDAHELAPTLEQDASYIVTPPLLPDAASGYALNAVGGVNGEGRRVWDWSIDDPSHLVAKLRARPLADQWYANHFPGGQFALAADLSGELEAVYSHDEVAMRLYGVASTEENPPEGQTLLIYQQPIDFFPFPLSQGKNWSQTGVVIDGTLRGLHPWSQDDVYEVQVDLAGEMRLPDFTFSQVLRVATKLTVKPKAGSTEGYTQRQLSWVFECFGEVGRATSLLITDPEQDPGPDFAAAREIRRLGWF